MNALAIVFTPGTNRTIFITILYRKNKHSVPKAVYNRCLKQHIKLNQIINYNHETSAIVLLNLSTASFKFKFL